MKVRATELTAATRRRYRQHFKVAVKVAASKHFVHWVMALGSGAKIIGPENLVHEVNEEIKRLAEQYRENLSNK